MTLQIVDTSPLRKMTRWAASLPDPILILDDPWWQERIQKADSLYVFPTFGCGARTYEDVLPLQQLAADKKIPFNTGTIARGFTPCQEKESALQAEFRKGSLYVFLEGHYTKESLNERFGQDVIEARCTPHDLGYICGP